MGELLREAGLLDERLRWRGGNSGVVFMGDFFNRGPDGVGCVELAMRLEREVAASGGRVWSLLGNHDVLLLAAHRFGGPFVRSWLEEGGVEADLRRLTAGQVRWLRNLPAMLLLEDRLFVHADATLYPRYGATVEAVNNSWRALLCGDDRAAWDRLLDEFGEHWAFEPPDREAEAASFLSRFGGRQLIHGHTPIAKMTGAPPEDVREPLVYAGGLCVNVDHGLYRGGPGFVYRIAGGDTLV